MTQEQLKEESKQYINYNLHYNTTLELIIDILDDFSSMLFEYGFTKQSDTLTSIELTLKDLLIEGERF